MIQHISSAPQYVFDASCRRQAERGVVEAIAACQKPDQTGLQALLAPVAAQIGAADKLTGGRRGAAFNHFKAAADALPALAWIAYTGTSCGVYMLAQGIMRVSLPSAVFALNEAAADNAVACVGLPAPPTML